MNKMNFKSLLLTGLGLAIGANVMTYIGVLTGVNGKAAILTVILCLILGVGGVAPYFLLTCLTSIKGSYYSIAKEGLGDTMGGICQYMAIADLLFMASYPIAVADYVCSLLPGLNKLFVSIVFMILVFLILIKGMGFFSKLQSVFTVIMLAALGMFLVFGIAKMVQMGAQPLDFMQEPSFDKNVVLKGVPIIIFYSYGYGNIFFYSSVAQKPTRNVPKVMLIVAACTMTAWILVTLVSTNILPIEQTAGQPLTYVAAEILPQPLFYVFVIAGAMLAIITSYLAMIPGSAMGFRQAAKEGWFPKALARENKKGAPWINYLFIMIVAFVLIISGIPLSAIFLEVSLLDSVWIGIIALSFLFIPKKHPEIFKNTGRIKPWMFYLAASIALVLNIYVFYLSVKSLPVQVVIVSVIAIIAFVIIAKSLIKSGRIHSENNFEVIEE